MPQLALFDLDGTLYDTFQPHFQAYAAALSDFGFPAPDAAYFAAHCFGHHFSDFIGALAPGASEAQQQAIHAAKLAHYPACLTAARENTQLFQLIAAMRPSYRLVVVSTASRACVDSVLAHFGRTALFDLVLAQEDIPVPKPDPAGFLLAMRHFGASPEETIIFEDSQTGIRAARATGATVLVVNQF